MTIKEIKKELKNLEELEKASTAADLAYDADPMNPEVEKAFDEAYKAEYESFMKISSALVEFSDGELKIAEARTIVSGKREQLKKMLETA